MYELILASQSPRRLQLLEEAGFLVTTVPVKVSETIDKNLNLPEALKALALRKAQAFVEQHNSLERQKILVLGADTVVAIDGEVLGKPKTAAEAELTLRRLSGRSHSVLTAVALILMDQNASITFCDETLVEFRVLQDQEIREYVATGEPMDKAGSYGIQGGAGKFVRHIRGSWSNVVGLPMELLQDQLNLHHIRIARRT